MVEQPIKPTESFRLTVGGDVQASNGTYLRRDVDDQLYAVCLESKFAYVLACRQIGKSSLKNAVAERLMAQGIRVARIDLNRIGQDVKKAEDWYFSLVDEIATSIGLADDVEEWWEAQPQRSTMSQRFLRFLDQVLLVQIQGQIVIFIDEIDMTLELPFTDDLFASIRSLYNDRSQNKSYQRLSFVLLGVATPDELIKDPNRTPFNVGESIEIRDFDKEDIAPFFVGAIEESHPGKGLASFGEVFEWTNGHPYLTQKLCKAMIESQYNDDNSVCQQVNILFLKEENRAESNLKFVQSRMLGDRQAPSMFRTYRGILKGRKISGNQKSLAVNRLKLYGLVKPESGELQVRNRIYERVFDLGWCNENDPFDLNRVLAIAGAALTIIILLIVGIVYWNDTVRIPNVAEDKATCIRQTQDYNERFVCMVELIQLDHAFLFNSSTNVHTEKTTELFFTLSREQQLAVFRVESTDSHVLVANLYQSLVDPYLLDVSQSSNNLDLLKVMTKSLCESDNESAKALKNELKKWVLGREHIQRGLRSSNPENKRKEYTYALSYYGDSIGENSNKNNPGPLFERALLHIELGQPQPALDLFEIIAGIITESDVDVAAIFSSTIQLLPTSTFSSTLTNTSLVTSTNISSVASTLMLTSNITTIGNSEVQASPEPLIVPRFENDENSQLRTNDGLTPTTPLRSIVERVQTSPPLAFSAVSTAALAQHLRSAFVQFPHLIEDEFNLSGSYPNLTTLGLIPEPAIQVSFAAESENEVLVIVADFVSPNGEDPSNVTTVLIEEMQQTLIDLENIRIERIFQSIDEQNGTEEARAVSESPNINASVVIWGNYVDSPEPGLRLHYYINKNRTTSLDIGFTNQFDILQPTMFDFQLRLGELVARVTAFQGGLILYEEGRNLEAVDYFSKAVESDNRALPIDQKAIFYLYQGNNYLQLEQYEQALFAYEKALELMIEEDDHVGEGTTLRNIGQVYAEQGKYEQALEIYQQALGIQLEIGNRFGEAILLYNMGEVSAAQGRYGDALLSYEQSLRIQREIGDPSREAVTVENIENIKIALGNSPTPQNGDDNEDAAIAALITPKPTNTVRSTLVPVGEQGYSYELQAGDTWAGIAQVAYGAFGLWQELCEFNIGLSNLDDCRLVELGTLIEIPIRSSLPTLIVDTTFVARPAPGVNRYFITGSDVTNYDVGKLLGVSAKGITGIAFDAAVVSVVDKNADNLIVQVIFQNADAPLDSLADLAIETELENINLEQMVPVSSKFVGFILNDSIIRLVPNVTVKSGTELEAVQLTANGDALPFAGEPRLITVDTMGVNGDTARVSSTAELPPLGTLLIFNLPPPTATPSPTAAPTSSATPTVETTATPTAQSDVQIFESFDGAVALDWKNSGGEWGINNQRLQIRRFEDGMAGVFIEHLGWTHYSVQMNQYPGQKRGQNQ